MLFFVWQEGILFLPQTSLWKHNGLNYMLHRLLIYVCLLHVLITGILPLIIPLTVMGFGMGEQHHMVRASLQTHLAASLLNLFLIMVSSFSARGEKQGMLQYLVVITLKTKIPAVLMCLPMLG